MAMNGLIYRANNGIEGVIYLGNYGIEGVIQTPLASSVGAEEYADFFSAEG